MSIVGQNSILNQFVPTFYLKNLLDKQILVYDEARKAFINVTPSGGGTSPSIPFKLGELTNVSDSVDNPAQSQNGQALVYNSLTSTWENKFVDYNTLLNKPTTGTVSSVSITSLSGIVSSITNPTTTPAITLYLGNITPISVTSSGNITANGSITATGTIAGSNFTGSSSGTNTGDQTITLSGDVVGTGIGPITASLISTGVVANTYGSATQIPIITVDSKGRITAATTATIPNLNNTPNGQIIYGTGTGVSSSPNLTYTSVDNTLRLLGSTPTISSGSGLPLRINSDTAINLSINNSPVLTINNAGSITINGTTGVSGQILTSNGPGAPATWQDPAAPDSTTLTGDITGTGSGTIVTTLSTVNTNPGTFGDGLHIPQVVINNKGLTTSVVLVPVDTTVSDFIDVTETLVILPRRQYVVTGSLEILGSIENNGRIAII